ncbi:MAG: ammonia-forming cytochrome c nitrite reductase subunit c552, partial [Acidobacteria bacterium]|nr:ammonia-forming cytochrome c nitrite reductase subunit c552 [Acidobacteriota bacterium]
GEHQVMESNSQLCGQCHGNLRFPDTDHLSYNIETGTGGIGVTDTKTMPGVGCTDCHMYASETDDSISGMFHGHTWDVSVQEEDGTSSVSCSQCHDNISTKTQLEAAISTWRTEFQALDETAGANVSAAATAMEGVSDASLQAKLEEAQHNLNFADSDESTGFHNHKYLMALLNDANSRALEILAALNK